ncbi:hypothetical protein [Paracoccus niistensis]|uniref:Apea-like HEPN domain-containing protein n=1 Tax=Paracoccus niistensis TaxID=632935 RepID=A0ABV6I1J7_9RHOB
MYCFGYTFPFKIFCHRSVSGWESISKRFNDVTITSSPPFTSDLPTKRACPSFEFGKSPALAKRGISTDRRDLGLVILPTFQFDENGNTSAVLTFTENPDLSDVEALPCNAVQIDIEADTEEKASTIADRIHRTWLRQMRRLTKQYWIGFFPSYFEGNLRTQFEVDQNYDLKGEPYTHNHMTLPNKEVIAATEDVWRESWNNLRDEPFPSSLDHLLDGHHFAAADEQYRAIISLATCIERSKYSIWQHLHTVGVCGRNDYKNAMNDTKKPERYFSELLEVRTGRSLFDEFPELENIIRTIWIVRGKVAHGLEDDIPQKDRWLVEKDRLLGSANALFEMLRFEDSIIKMHAR